jgi:hypothetical protein
MLQLRATLLPPGRVRPESSRCSTSRTACDLPVHQFGRGVAALHVVTLHSSSSFLCCWTRASLRSCRIAGLSAAILAKLPPCAASLPSVWVCLEPPRFTFIRARPNRTRPWPASRPACIALPVPDHHQVLHARGLAVLMLAHVKLPR